MVVRLGSTRGPREAGGEAQLVCDTRHGRVVATGRLQEAATQLLHGAVEAAREAVQNVSSEWRPRGEGTCVGQASVEAL